jgi:hypothetical protein
LLLASPRRAKGSSLKQHWRRPIHAQPPDIQEADIDAIIAFLPIFQAKDFKFGELKTEGGIRFCFSEEARRFIQAVYDHGWVVPFNWPAWQHNAVRYYESPESLKTADIDTIRKLLTTHARKEQFCLGHLNAMFEEGHLTAILQRLKEIRETQS